MEAHLAEYADAWSAPSPHCPVALVRLASLLDEAGFGKKTCGRCKQDGFIVTHREDGPICRRCYVKDPLVMEECASCGRMRNPGRRLDDGTALCANCNPRPERECAR
ncbi:hypothetical protein [Streptomyces brasiliensis]|uniref:Uncharacterized protein n=1 Tax=Streptomyces brasiliensis TaxID=1954 RepID=A0A917PDY4_9ACTN|nr:hypothetical protein [Streptomyces brasiliensis]GGJ72080.1 hypothetical protein GCM10010121_098300 [Streptomyces brasiliensis]